MNDTPDAVLTALFRHHRRATRTTVPLVSPTAAELAAFLGAPDEVAEVSGALERLLAEGRVGKDGAGWRLDEAHVAHARAVHARVSQARFGAWMTANDASAVYRAFCRRVFDLPFPHFGAFDATELAEIVDALAVGPGAHVLDLGCGTGTVAEHVAATTGAAVHGIDFAEAAIALARSRAGPLTTFEVADLDGYEPPRAAFDAIASFDTIYFAEDLERLVAACARGLCPGGRLVAPCLLSIEDGEPLDGLAPDATRVARALAAAGLAYEVRDRTPGGLALWERTRAVLAETEEDFRAEGSHARWVARKRECDAHLARFAAGRARRYLYVATVSGSPAP